MSAVAQGRHLVIDIKTRKVYLSLRIPEEQGGHKNEDTAAWNTCLHTFFYVLQTGCQWWSFLYIPYTYTTRPSS